MAPPGNQAATEKTNINLYHSENPVYSPKAPVKRKNWSASKKKRFLGRRCGCENGPFFSSSEQPPPYRLFCSRSNLLPTLHGSLRFSLTERSSLSSHPPLSHCRSFFRFIGVRLDGTSHPSGSRSTEKREILSSATPVRFADPENLRFQAVSKSCLTELMVISQPLVAHGVGGQDGDELVRLGWNG